MEQELNKLYSELAERLIDIIPVDWNKIYLLGEVITERSFSTTFYFEETASKTLVRCYDIPQKYNVSKSIFDELFHKLWPILKQISLFFRDNGQPAWDQLSFYLESNGKFKVDFLYDRMSAADAGQPEREAIWAYNTFGLIEEEGSYMRKLLDKYLEKNQS